MRPVVFLSIYDSSGWQQIKPPPTPCPDFYRPAQSNQYLSYPDDKYGQKTQTTTLWLFHLAIKTLISQLKSKSQFYSKLENNTTTKLLRTLLKDRPSS